jgi:tRNA threonylcarbamoyladenosine biosynthesis protein TsaB
VHVLAVDTATAQVGVAVGSEDGTVAEVRLARGRRHAEQLAPAIRYVLEESGVGVGDLAAVAVGVGPGLFTGVRVGVTTAKVMAHALGVPAVPVCSLDLIAHPLRYGGRPVVVVSDARRGEVYVARYRPGAGGQEREAGPELRTPSEVAAALGRLGSPLVAGDGAHLHRPVFESVEGVELASATSSFPSPSALAELACGRLARGEASDPHSVTPLYLRRSDAQIDWERRHRRGEGAA